MSVYVGVLRGSLVPLSAVTPLGTAIPAGTWPGPLALLSWARPWGGQGKGRHSPGAAGGLILACWTCLAQPLCALREEPCAGVAVGKPLLPLPELKICRAACAGRYLYRRSPGRLSQLRRTPTSPRPGDIPSAPATGAGSGCWWGGTRQHHSAQIWDPLQKGMGRRLRGLTDAPGAWWMWPGRGHGGAGPQAAAPGQRQGGWSGGGAGWWSKRQWHKPQVGMLRALGMRQPWDGSPGGGESPDAAIPIPLQRGQGMLVLSRGLGSLLGSWLPPQHPLPKPKLGHGRGSRAIRAGSSSVKLQSLA